MKQPAIKRRMPRKVRWVLWATIASVITAFVLGAIWHHHNAAALAAMSPVETYVVKRAALEKSVQSAGTIESNRDVEIKCRAGGPIAELPIDISQHVKAGDILCKLDPTDEQLAVNVAMHTVTQSTVKLEQMKLTYQQAVMNLETTRSRELAALESAKVKAANLQAKADRQKQLKDQQLGSAEDFETAQTDAATAKSDAENAQETVNELKQQEIQLQSKKLDIDNAASQLESDKFNLDQQKQQLAYTTVISPIDGVVSGLSVQVGTMIQSGTGGFSGGTSIGTLSDLSHIFVVATVDQSDIGGVQLGQAVRTAVDSYPNREFAAVVIWIAPVGNNTSNVVTFQVKIEVTDKDKGMLRPGMTGTATIVEDQRANVLVIPTAAVTHRNGQAFVQMAGGKQQAVTLGLEGSDNVEVISGLAEGGKVIVQEAELPTRWKSGDGGPPK